LSSLCGLRGAGELRGVKHIVVGVGVTIQARLNPQTRAREEVQ
jgi:hypothetical protein